MFDGFVYLQPYAFLHFSHFWIRLYFSFVFNFCKNFVLNSRIESEYDVESNGKRKVKTHMKSLLFTQISGLRLFVAENENESLQTKQQFYVSLFPLGNCTNSTISRLT